LPEAERKAELQKLTPNQKARLRWRWQFWARPSQLAPADQWLTWLILAGRGWGKTRTGAEWVRDQVEQRGKRRIALVGSTSADVRDVMIEGPSGILAVCPPWNRPKYEPSKRRITWPNGAMAIGYSADEPNRLRGPQHDAAWCDELAAWRYEDAWDQLNFGLRIGDHPQKVVTTTPRPTKLVRELAKEKGTHLTGGSTYDNRANLSPVFFDRIVSAYEGTRLGRQELHAEVLLDNPEALWALAKIEETRVREAPPLRRIVVSVDPSTSSNKSSSEAGIVVAGLGYNGHGYVLDDLSDRLKPQEWAQIAVNGYHKHEADRIVAEVNNGGEMVELTIRTVDKSVAYKAVHATRGKYTRAEPVAALYEQGKVHHVGGFAKLEDQMTNWTPGEDSPDRLDAMVWALSELMLGAKSPAGKIASGVMDVGMRSAGEVRIY
jgi:phage terminase large subunit-like protein